MMNGLYVVQNGQFYTVYTPQGIIILRAFMGADGQYAQDVVALNSITKTMAKRWNVPNRENK